MVFHTLLETDAFGRGFQFFRVIQKVYYIREKRCVMRTGAK